MLTKVHNKLNLKCGLGMCSDMINYLNTLRKGEKAKIESIDAGKEATKRLYEMGLNTHATLNILKNDIGPILASVNGNKIAIGRGLAGKVAVSKIKE